MKTLRAIFSPTPPDLVKTFLESDRWKTIKEEQAEIGYDPRPVELDLEETQARADALRVEINRDNSEIAYWTSLRDEHLAMLAGEEAKAKVLTAFSERTIEAGKTQMAAE